MFKKLVDKIVEVNAYHFNMIKNDIHRLFTNEIMISNMTSTLDYQIKLCDQVLHDKYESDDSTYKAVVLIPSQGNPVIFKDGKKVSNDSMTSFSVDWADDGNIDVSVDYNRLL